LIYALKKIFSIQETLFNKYSLILFYKEMREACKKLQAFFIQKK